MIAFFTHSVYELQSKELEKSSSCNFKGIKIVLKGVNSVTRNKIIKTLNELISLQLTSEFLLF